MSKTGSPLVPVPMVDKNGKTVTRWTRLLETGEPAINIPAPQSPALTQMAETVFARLFPDIDEDNGYLIDAMGGRWYQTYEFCSHALSVLPPKTLNELIERYDYNRSPVQRYITKKLIGYVGDMYDHGQSESADDYYTENVRKINNALVFFDPLMTVIPLEKYPPADDDIENMINWGVQFYEDKNKRVNNFTYLSKETSTDYGTLPRRKREEVIGFFLGMYLTARFGEGESYQRPSPELTKFIAENLDRQEEIRDLAEERSVNDVPLLRRLLHGGDTPALTGGEL